MHTENPSVTRQAYHTSTLSALVAGDASDVERTRAFWRRVERYDAGAQVGQDHPPGVEKQLVIVSGWACELRILPDGRRQIFSFLLPGDTILFRGTESLGSRGVVALTRLEVISAGLPQAADVGGRDTVRQALQDAALQREQRLYDHLVRMGRLSAKERVIHLLLELSERLACVGLVKGGTFKIPLTQEVLADALGLSIVHINRTLKELRKADWVRIKSGSVTLKNWARLAAASCYQSQIDAPGFGWPEQRSAWDRAALRQVERPQWDVRSPQTSLAPAGSAERVPTPS